MMIIDISKLLLTSFVRLKFYLFKFYRCHRMMLCIKKFASYIRIYYHYPDHCSRDIKYNIYIFLH